MNLLISSIFKNKFNSDIKYSIKLIQVIILLNFTLINYEFFKKLRLKG